MHINVLEKVVYGFSLFNACHCEKKENYLLYIIYVDVERLARALVSISFSVSKLRCQLVLASCGSVAIAQLADSASS